MFSFSFMRWRERHGRARRRAAQTDARPTVGLVRTQRHAGNIDASKVGHSRRHAGRHNAQQPASVAARETGDFEAW